MKYFKLDKDKREIIIDKYKKYNVNVDILDLIIDLQQEIERLNNIINELENIRKEIKKYIEKNVVCCKKSDMLVELNVDDLLNILNKGDNEC